MRAEWDRQPLAGQRREPQDGAVARLAVHLGQHHVRHGLGEKARVLHGRQLAGVAQHQDRLAKGHEIVGHLLAHHRHLVEHQEVRVAQDRLLVDQELRLVDVLEAQLELGDARHCEPPLGRAHARQVAPQRRQILGRARDLFRRRLGDPVDQAVDGLGGCALARHHERRLAGEGGEKHAAKPARGHRLKPQRLHRHGGDRGLAGPGIAEEAEDLLVVPPRLVPVADRGDGAVLGFGKGDCHARSSQQRAAKGQNRQRKKSWLVAMRGSRSPASAARSTSTALSDSACAAAGSNDTCSW